MHEAQSWRELLGKIISDNKEKTRLTEELHVTAITLGRWANGESDPRPHNLRHLVNILPEYREKFFDLMKGEKVFKDTFNPTQEDEVKDIPSEFYVHVFETRAKTPARLRYRSTCNLILKQALGQLDADQQGMGIWVVTCMPPSGLYNKVRSLRESIGIGTPPWPPNLEQQAMFLGAESLAGNVVTLCRPNVVQDLKKENSQNPLSITENEKSSAIAPILYAGNIAGVLLVSSAQSNYFTSQARVSLIYKYADLLALAFDPKDFYSPDDIALNVMPHQDDQKPYFARFQQMLRDATIEMSSKHLPANNDEAELMVWQRLEKELLQHAARQ
jgi:hypothetical protein